MYIAEAAILVRKAVAYWIGSSLLDNVIDHGLRLENRAIQAMLENKLHPNDFPPINVFEATSDAKPDPSMHINTSDEATLRSN